MKNIMLSMKNSV